MKTLIIDDEEDTRSIASMSLSILGGVEVIEAEGGPDGILKAERERPDVILLDMMMPVMDGSQTLVELLKNPLTKDIPVIFLTAKAMSSEIERLKRMGAIGVLTKPFDPTTLATQVQSILASKGVSVSTSVAPNPVSQSTTMSNPSISGGYQTIPPSPAPFAAAPAPMAVPVAPPQAPAAHVQQGYTSMQQGPLQPNPGFAAEQQTWSQQAVTSPYPAQSVAQYRQPYQNPFQQLANSQLPTTLPNAGIQATTAQHNTVPPAGLQQTQPIPPLPIVSPVYPASARQQPDGLEDWQIMPPSSYPPEITAQQIISGPLPQMPDISPMPDQQVCSRSVPPTAAPLPSPLPYRSDTDNGVGSTSGAYPQTPPNTPNTKQYAATQPEVTPAGTGAHTSAAHLARIVKEPKTATVPDNPILEVPKPPAAGDTPVVLGVFGFGGTDVAEKKLPQRKKFHHPWGPPQMPNWTGETSEAGDEDQPGSAPPKDQTEGKK